MRWSLILYLPAVVAMAWAFIIAMTKRHLTRAQVLLCLTLVVDAFAITVVGVYFRGRAGGLFLYDYLFEVSSSFCTPLFYISICSLTEPRGATLRQRRVFLIPLLFTVGLTIAAFGMHPSRYQEMCVQVFESGRIPWQPGDFSYNFMIFWNQIVYPVSMIVTGTVLLILSGRKAYHYKRRFNAFYAQGLNLPNLSIREIIVVASLFLPFGLLTIYFIAFRPLYYKYGLIACAVILTVFVYLTGRFAYRYSYDARFLADYTRQKIENA